MIHMSKNDDAKGWYLGPWNSNIEIPIGFANRGIREEHVHRRMNEIYLIARGTSTLVIDNKQIALKEGDIIVVEPNEIHMFKDSSEDYLHFVIHTPFSKDDKELIT